MQTYHIQTPKLNNTHTKHMQSNKHVYASTIPPRRVLKLPLRNASVDTRHC